MLLPALQLQQVELDLCDVVVGEKALFTPQSPRPPARGICTDIEF